MARLVEQIEQLEEAHEAAMQEIDRLQSVVSNIEAAVGDRDATIGELQWANGELQEFKEFVREHFPEAVKAYEVRERMEKASEA